MLHYHLTVTVTEIKVNLC